MSILSRSADLVYTFRFLKLLVTKFKDTKAYELGIIDEDGNRIKSKTVTTSEEKSSYTPFHKLVFNIKRIMAKVPGGSSTLASYATALYLIKEKYQLSDNNLEKILKECNLEVIDLLNESSSWFLLENKMLSPGIYKVRNDKVINSTYEQIVNANDKIRILDNSFPIGDIFGIDIYEAIHISTNQKIFITIGEITR